MSESRKTQIGYSTARGGTSPPAAAPAGFEPAPAPASPPDKSSSGGRGDLPSYPARAPAPA
ncbi:MAG: hypothetical protein KC431_28530, partial [Myxococcales bacterium]|nr:hypothetical protein [Myxococcales bacterium]